MIPINLKIMKICTDQDWKPFDFERGNHKIWHKYLLFLPLRAVFGEVDRYHKIDGNS